MKAPRDRVSTSTAALEAYLHEHVPLSAAMGLEVREDENGRRRYEAPFELNRNHHRTAFGGSVSTIAILAGWAEVHMGLRAEGFSGDTVIQRNQIDYEAPGTGKLVAILDDISTRAWSRLLRAIDRSGRGRVEVAVTVLSGDERVARFSGSYVALLG